MNQKEEESFSEYIFECYFYETAKVFSWFKYNSEMNTWKLIGNFFDDEEPFDLRDFRGYTFEELNRIILYKLRIKIINERIAELEAENRSIEKKAEERILKLNKEIEMKIKSNEVMSGDEEEVFSIKSCSDNHIDNSNIEILKNTTAIDADSSFKPKFVLEIVSLILTSTSSILGEVFKPDSSEQVKKQLQEIFNKLDSISRELNDIKLQIPCTASIQDFRNNVRINIQNLVDGVRTYFLTNHSVDRENLKIVCKDPSRGINYIYSAIKDLEYEHLKTIRDCARYHKNSIDGWAQTMMNLAAMFVFAHLGCEKAFEYKTTFDINRFESQIKSNVVYYVRKGFPEAAALDQGEFGVKPMAQKILNENVDAWTVFNRMNSIYPFNFHVIRYSAGIQGWDKHCSTTFGYALCGGYHWVRELDHGNNAYLGWCYEGNLNNQEIRLERDGNHACNSKDRTINANPSMQFAYAISINHRNKWWEFAGTDIRCQDLGDWTSVCASKFKDDSYYLQKVVLEPVSIFFP